MLAFVRKNQILVASCCCVFLSLYILTSAARGRLKNDPVGPVLLWFVRPLQIVAQATTASIQELQRSFTNVSAYKAENEKLKKRIVDLEAERNRLLEAEATNLRLQQLLEFRSQLPADSITASIIANSASTWFQSCLLNKGSADGVEKGMAVVTPLGAMGQVVAVTGRTSKVLLLTDPNSGVDVMVQRSRARGIVSGSLDNGTVMKYVKRSEDVQEGDRLITSGLDGVFPKGLTVGTVTKVRKQHVGLFQFIEVTPTVTSSRVEDVLVVPPEGAVAEVKPR
jgi:rod shape-determining protein MreC